MFQYNTLKKHAFQAADNTLNVLGRCFHVGGSFHDYQGCTPNVTKLVTPNVTMFHSISVNPVNCRTAWGIRNWLTVQSIRELVKEWGTIFPLSVMSYSCSWPGCRFQYWFLSDDGKSLATFSSMAVIVVPIWESLIHPLQIYIQRSKVLGWSLLSNRCLSMIEDRRKQRFFCPKVLFFKFSFIIVVSFLYLLFFIALSDWQSAYQLVLKENLSLHSFSG